MRMLSGILLLVLVPSLTVDADVRTIRLEQLDLTYVSQGWGSPTPNATIVDKPLTLAGKVYPHGLGSHAPALIRIALDGQVERFQALVGVDDETEGKGSLAFKAYADGKLVFDSGVIQGGDPAQPMDLTLRGVRSLLLLVSNAGDDNDYDHADWAEAKFSYAADPPQIVASPVEEKVLLTPPPPKSPRIHGPTVYGVRPGHPLIYRVPCSGERPLRFAADGLPDGLLLDETTGIVLGTVADRTHQTYQVQWKAENRHGTASRAFRIVVGDTLALTPPMGWNSWYIHYHRVTEHDMRGAARALVDSGMAAFGYQYVNIDDCWMKKKGDAPYRAESGASLPNAKFPDMKGMVDEIHRLGLKAGLYTSPGPWTCAGYLGAYQHEQAEVDQYAAWGFDFLKYDWCSYTQVASGEGREKFTRPYTMMGELLQHAPRDIVLNLCQYGMDDVWEWGRAVGGHCSRTTGDLGLARGTTLPGFYNIGLSNARHPQYAGPGYWNDPDYILIGWVGDAHGMKEGTPTNLTGNEQYSYMSMWCLMASPLVFSGDMQKLDDFTLNVLCNHEVIEIDQDPLGRQAHIVRNDGESLVMAKKMSDGSTALGLFNLSELETEISVTWKELGIRGPQRLRDLWRQQEIGVADGSYQATVGRHGVMLVRLWPQGEH